MSFANLIKCEHFSPQNDCISESLIQCWTPQAVECWMVGQKCSGCSVGMANYSFECQMPKVIAALLKTQGPPPQNLCEDFKGIISA